MTIRSLAEVGARLEETALKLSGDLNSADTYETYESLAIQILDSEFDNYGDGILEEYLLAYLKLKRMELNRPALD